MAAILDMLYSARESASVAVSSNRYPDFAVNESPSPSPVAEASLTERREEDWNRSEELEEFVVGNEMREGKKEREEGVEERTRIFFCWMNEWMNWIHSSHSSHFTRFVMKIGTELLHELICAFTTGVNERWKISFPFIFISICFRQNGWYFLGKINYLVFNLIFFKFVLLFFFYAIYLLSFICNKIVWYIFLITFLLS